MGRRRGTSAFPVARIKKMMQSDDDVGKIATVTPLLVAKALELMMEYVLKEAAEVAQERHTKTVTPQHLKTCVMNNDSFDFLRHVLKNVQSVDVDKPRRRRSVKRPRSPVVEGRRVRRGTNDQSDARVVKMVKDDHDDVVDGVDAVMPVPSHVVAAVEKDKLDGDDDDDDYDDDDEHPTVTDTKTDNANTEDPASLPVESDSQNPPGRMSVSALLS